MAEWLALWTPHLMGLAFAFALGACVGSFINVVAWRMPLGMSITHPPSRCPVCGRRLRTRENLPIVGWLLAKGRCKSCGVGISLQYPVIELLVALLFALVYAMCFVAEPLGWWGRSWAQWFQLYGLFESTPALLCIVTLLSCLVASTLTDIRTCTIPLGVTMTATLAGVAGWTLQGAMASPSMARAWPLPSATWWMTGAALAGGGAVLVANALLARGVLKRSFADYAEFVPEGETLADYPHARREMRHELVFFGMVALSSTLGAFALAGSGGEPSPVLQGLCGSIFGYLVGAGVVWLVRIVATIVKGIEAMGMGDVHLLGAAGACLGWIDPLAAFFIAPFFGLAWVGATGLLSVARRGAGRRELPYGPHLAIAIVGLILCRGVFVDAGRLLFPGLIPSTRALHDEGSGGEMHALSDRPKGQRTSEKGLSNEEDMDRRRLPPRRGDIGGV